jgi:hypothetical protein
VDECLNLQTLKEEGIAIIGSSRSPLIPHHAIPHPHYRPMMRFAEDDDEDEEDSDEEEEDSDEEGDDDEESDINPWLMVCPFARCGRTMDARSFQSHIISNHMRERHKKHFCPVCALLVATVSLFLLSLSKFLCFSFLNFPLHVSCYSFCSKKKGKEACCCTGGPI